MVKANNIKAKLVHTSKYIPFERTPFLLSSKRACISGISSFKYSVRLELALGKSLDKK